jgi:hypothetical protein
MSAVGSVVARALSREGAEEASDQIGATIGISRDQFGSSGRGAQPVCGT